MIIIIVCMPFRQRNETRNKNGMLFIFNSTTGWICLDVDVYDGEDDEWRACDKITFQSK